MLLIFLEKRAVAIVSVAMTLPGFGTVSRVILKKHGSVIVYENVGIIDNEAQHTNHYTSSKKLTTSVLYKRNNPLLR